MTRGLEVGELGPLGGGVVGEKNSWGCGGGVESCPPKSMAVESSGKSV